MASGRRTVIELTSQQAARQRARRRAVDPAMSARIASAQRDQRISRLATRLAVTLARRDESIHRWDRRVGDLLVELTRVEHLTLDDYGPAFDKTAKMALDACSLFIPG